MTSTNTTPPGITESVPSTPVKKGRSRALIVSGVLIGTALVGFAIGRSGSSTATAAAPTPAPITVTEAPPPVTMQAPEPAPVTVTVTEPPPAPVVTGPAEEITKSGILVVGTDIKAGKWKTDGKIDPAKLSGYFAILADPTKPTSDVDNIITNDNPDGQAFATLEDGQGLENNNLHWVLVS